MGRLTQFGYVATRPIRVETKRQMASPWNGERRGEVLAAGA